MEANTTGPDQMFQQDAWKQSKARTFLLVDLREFFYRLRVGGRKKIK